jgi:hypothetical protein
MSLIDYQEPTVKASPLVVRCALAAACTLGAAAQAQSPIA